MFGDKPRSATRNVDVLADEIAVHARNEVFRIEVDVLYVAVQLRSDVVAQPLRIHAEFEIAQWAYASTAGLRHLRAGYGDEAVYVNVIRYFAPGELEHRGPKQRVEVND